MRPVAVRQRGSYESLLIHFSWDKRSISSILRRFFMPEILIDAFPLASTGAYLSPPASTLDDIREYIKGLPTEDHPEIFGLHANAAITFQQKETRSFINSVMIVGGRGSGTSSGAEARDAQVVQHSGLREGIHMSFSHHRS
jgi:dynein heavy chain